MKTTQREGNIWIPILVIVLLAIVSALIFSVNRNTINQAADTNFQPGVGGGPGLDLISPLPTPPTSPAVSASPTHSDAMQKSPPATSTP